ncbi:MAG TPA: HAD-IA family hydrolase [Myxococcota bacterium]|nr:HAD-IA family hydrolase [Myxococcota bacterium]
MDRFRAVLFDAAGTLIHLREPVGETYRRFALSYGVALPASRIEEAFRRVLRAAPPMVWPDAPPAEVAEHERLWWRSIVRGTFRAADSSVRFADFEGYFADLFAYFARPEAWASAPRALEALRALRAGGLRTGVVSNFDHRLKGLLEGLELSPELEVVIRPADAHAAKPDPRIFHCALRRLAVGAREAIYVGDDAEHDVAGAQAAGLRAIDASSLATLAELGPKIRALSKEKRS